MLPSGGNGTELFPVEGRALVRFPVGFAKPGRTGPVLLLVFVPFPAKVNTFGGSVPVIFPGFVVFLILLLEVFPGGTLNILPGGNVPVLLPGFVAFPTELNSPGEAGLCTLVMGKVGSVLLPGFVAFPPGAGRHVTTPTPTLQMHFPKGGPVHSIGGKLVPLTTNILPDVLFDGLKVSLP